MLCERYVKRYVKPDDVSIRQLARDTLERWKVDYDELTSEARGCVGEAIKREKEQKREERAERWRNAFVSTATLAAKGAFWAVLLILRGLFVLFLGTHVVLKLLFIKPTDSFRRSERLWTVTTCIILMFTCLICLHYQKSQQCCEQLRTHLGCEPFDFTVPCYGELKCAALSKVPQAVGVPKCTAFPRKGVLSDTIVAILITLTIVLPIRMVLQAVMQAGGKPVAPKHLGDAAGADPTPR